MEITLLFSSENGKKKKKKKKERKKERKKQSQFCIEIEAFAK